MGSFKCSLFGKHLFCLVTNWAKRSSPFFGNFDPLFVIVFVCLCIVGRLILYLIETRPSFDELLVASDFQIDTNGWQCSKLGHVDQLAIGAVICQVVFHYFRLTLYIILIPIAIIYEFFILQFLNSIWADFLYFLAAHHFFLPFVKICSMLLSRRQATPLDMVPRIWRIVLHILKDKLLLEARWIELSVRLISLDIFLLTTVIAGIGISSTLVGWNALTLHISWWLFKTIHLDEALFLNLVDKTIFARYFLVDTTLIGF